MKYALPLLLLCVLTRAQTPNLGLSQPPHGTQNWDVYMNGNSSIIDNIFGVGTCGGDGIHAVTYSAISKTFGCSSSMVSNSPSADQVITGTHKLTNNGTGFTGDPIAGFDANVQSAFVGSTQVSLTGTSLNHSPFNVGFQGVAQGTNANGGFGVASNDATTNSGEVPTGLGGSSFLASTVTNNGEAIGVEGDGFAQPSGPATIAAATGVYGAAHNIGAGTVTELSGHFADTAENSAGGTVTSNFGFDSAAQQTIGTTSAAFHAADQGSGATHYGILLAGVTHNDLGSGVTKVGNLLDSGMGASLPVCTDGSKNLTTSSCTTGKTYYVDQVAGNDSNSGLLTTAAWKTVAKVNAQSFVPDDKILFLRGDTWNEQLSPPTSGTSGHHITYGAYGTGANPVFNGGGARQDGMIITGQGFITAQNLTFTGGTGAGFDCESGCHDIIAQDSVAHDNAIQGFNCSGNGGAQTFNCIFRRDVAYLNLEFAGLFMNSTGYGLIEDSVAYSNGTDNFRDHGIYVQCQAGTLIWRNVSHDNAANGFKCGSTSNGGVLAYNVSYNNGRSGYFTDDNSTGASVYNSVSYHDLWGITAYNCGLGATFANVKNVIVRNATQYGVVTDACSSPGAITSITNNDVSNSTTANYHGIADQTGSNGNINTNPLFSNETLFAFGLLPGSPAIDSGSNLGDAYRVFAPQPSTQYPPWTLADQGSAGSGWEMGTFLFAPAESFPAAGIRGICKGAAAAGTTNGVALTFLGGNPSSNLCITATPLQIWGTVLTHACILQNFYINAGTAGKDATDAVMTLQDNAASLTLTCTVGAGTACHDTNHSFAAAAGDIIWVKGSTEAATTLADVTVAVDCR